MWILLAYLPIVHFEAPLAGSSRACPSQTPAQEDPTHSLLQDYRPGNLGQWQLQGKFDMSHMVTHVPPWSAEMDKLPITSNGDY